MAGTQLQPVNILIVDDREENIIALEALIRRDDINLITTTSPNEALRICWDQDIAIALVDVQMPEMDGFELVQILKSNPRTREMVVIFVTAISKETKYVVKGLESGAVDYLYKPLDPYITIAKVDAFISVVRSQQELKQKNIELEEFQKELVKAKEQAEAAKRVKESFLANMSHEIRTPINGIIGLAHLLKNTELSDDQKEFVKLLEVSSQSLLGVINDILDISKIEAGKFKIVKAETNIRDLVQAVVDLMKFRADEKNVKLVLEIDNKVPDYIIADALRLNQILMNLMGNAIKFTDKGSVTLRVINLDKKDHSAQLQFSIIDTGIGISEEGLGKVFNSFEQAEDSTAQKYGGTGLGLSIVKKLADLKGGDLSVSSIPGKGSTFTFTNKYEVITGKQNMEKKISVADLPKFKNVTILLAEDNSINQFMISKILTNWNICVDIVDDGGKVLDKIKDTHYDLILMDTHMPTMNGFEATRRIRTDFDEPQKNIPIISLSAAVLEEEQQAGWDAGVNDILSKPFDPVVLHQKISFLLGIN
ncbi:response regulator [Daejeonella sp.]|uniref:response regulator n=1 Tax=Daejeonella sp. TaxID=2805397 RepID=UPI00272F8F5A|nr:response regulator [Daejeonella sp.]MDP2415302.1 response regulator [Daejeonella sp.]